MNKHIKRQISVPFSSTEWDALNEFVQANGLKKWYVMKRAVIEYLNREGARLVER